MPQASTCSPLADLYYGNYLPAQHLHPPSPNMAGPLNNTNPDNGTANVRTDSLLRFMAYSAVAYGAKALNYYCWGGGIYWYNANSSLPGKPRCARGYRMHANAPSETSIERMRMPSEAWIDRMRMPSRLYAISASPPFHAFPPMHGSG